MPYLVINNYITADPKVCHGKPVFKGTRIMVWQILEMLAAGENQASIHKAFPSLKPEHIKSALSYASSITQTSNVIVNTQETKIPV